MAGSSVLERGIQIGGASLDLKIVPEVITPEFPKILTHEIEQVGIVFLSTDLKTGDVKERKSKRPNHYSKPSYGQIAAAELTPQEWGMRGIYRGYGTMQMGMGLPIVKYQTGEGVLGPTFFIDPLGIISAGEGKEKMILTRTEEEMKFKKGDIVIHADKLEFV